MHTATHPEDIPHRHDSRSRAGDHAEARSWTNYIPLFVLLGLTALAAAAKASAYGAGLSGASWMHNFMGLFLVNFAMLKLFDLPGFADGFHMYDVLARRVRAYGFVYPFLELALGLGYLARWRLDIVHPATVVLMLFGGAGVISALARGLDINCACMGNTLKVPLSTVALTEDLGMAAMAAVMWLT